MNSKRTAQLLGLLVQWIEGGISQGLWKTYGNENAAEFQRITAVVAHVGMQAQTNFNFSQMVFRDSEWAIAMKLDKKVAVVTGAARGIGQTIALAYAREGAGLSLWDIDDGGLKQTAKEIQEIGCGSLSVGTDVTHPEEIAAAVQATLDRFGRIDILVNSAALNMSYVVPRERRATYPFWEIDPERWRRLLDVNITGAFLCCQQVAQSMVKRGSGAIINITTGNDTKLRRGYSPYGASKAGLEVMTVSISKELEPLGVRVNLLQPGGAVNLRGENDPSLLPYDVMVSAALYLASDESQDLSAVMIIGKDWIEG